MLRLRSSRRRGAALLTSLLVLTGCAQAHDPEFEDATDTEPKVAPSLQDSLHAGQSVVALVELSPAPETVTVDGGLSQGGSASTVGGGDDTSLLDEAVDERAAYYEQTQQAVLDEVDPASVELITRYQHVPFLYVRLNDELGLSALAARSDVKRIHAEQQYEHELAESLPLIGQPAVAAAGKTGAGTSVAVLDTGCDYTRSAFGSCSAAGGTCKVAYAADFATSDGSRDDNGHGTNVSAIVLGVAPAAKVLALDVFAGATAPSSAILSAIDWVIQNRATYNIASVNMSLGSGGYTAQCSSDVFASALSNLRAAGIVPVVASGNNAYTNAISSPACTPSALSVGAVYDALISGTLNYSVCSDANPPADKVTCFSNSASFLSMLAPGAVITAGGYSMTGTSQAAPHVAGAAAVLRAAFASESVDQLITRLVDNGPSIKDARNNVTKHRLDLAAAVGVSSPAPTPGQGDTTGPTGTLTINGGASATNVTGVTLTIDASDASGVATMCISNTTSCSAFAAFATSKAWTLTTGSALKTVRVWLRDTVGNVSVLSATITLDQTKPTAGALRAMPGNASVALSWDAATDAGSGIDRYRLYFAPTTAPACGAGTLAYEGSALSYAHTGLTNGSTYGYRLCPVDRAGNVGAGSIVTARPAPELTPPTGSVAINGGATLTNNRSVTLTLAGSDASGVTSMCISNTASCRTWQSFATTKLWTLGVANGLTTVYVWYRDTYGNATTTPVTAQITVDTTKPVIRGSLVAVPADAQVALSWDAATDAGSGIAGYRVYAAANSAPACGAGTLIYDGSELTFTHGGLTNGLVYGFRVCPVDAVGNVGVGIVTTARPAPEYAPPTGSVVINDGATLTNNRRVTLTLAGNDASGVTAMCISSSTSCRTWRAFTTTTTWTLAASNGVAKVYVWYRDLYGNTMTVPVSAQITVDTTRPLARGTLSAAPADAQVVLSWEAATDGLSGVAGYRVYLAGTRTPTCGSGTLIYEGPALTCTSTGLVNGMVYGYRVCPVDVAGNVGTGITAVSRPAPEFVAPTGSVVINGGATLTRSRTATLTLAGSDASGVTAMCISNSTSCRTWQTFSTTRTWTLGVSNGTARVYVWYRDPYGNAMTSPAVDETTVDTAPPSNSALSSSLANGSTTLSWTASTDAGGVASYRLVYAVGTRAPACSSGTLLYQGTQRQYVHSGLTAGTRYSYRVCATDVAGNTNGGGTAIVTAQ